MTDALQRLRTTTAAWLANDEAEIVRLNDRVAVYRNILACIDDEIGQGVNPIEPADEPRREKRDIRGAVLAVFERRQRVTAEGGPPNLPLSVTDLKGLVEVRIGELTESALARSLSSLVGDGKVIERDGVFSLPAPPRLQDAAK